MVEIRWEESVSNSLSVRWKYVDIYIGGEVLFREQSSRLMSGEDCWAHPPVIIIYLCEDGERLFKEYWCMEKQMSWVACVDWSCRPNFDIPCINVSTNLLLIATGVTFIPLTTCTFWESSFDLRREKGLPGTDSGTGCGGVNAVGRLQANSSVWPGWFPS